jgi:hypothetical protein
MDATSFKNALQEAKPSSKFLVDIGLNDAEAAEFLWSFDLHERTIERDNSLPDSVLHDLFARFDVSRVEVGMVRFCDTPEQASYGFILGRVETDYLTLQIPCGEVTVRDFTDPEHTTWKCARDGASLLAALAEAAKHLSECIASNQSGLEPRRQTIDQCTLLAGGPLYEDFYKMLLGPE